MTRVVSMVAVVVGCALAASCGGPKHDGGDAGGDASVGPDACVGCDLPACQQAGCRPNQRCEPSSEGALMCIPGACEPGFQWQGSECVAIEGATCAGTGSIAGECSALHRICVDDADGVRCGECDSGYVEAGSVCREGAECAAAGCGLMNRTCLYADGVASCGDCRAGYVDVDGVCDPSSCDVCAQEHRACVEGGASLACGACEAGYVEDSSLQCVPILSCETLGCAAQHRPCGTDPTPHCLEACDAGWIWDATLKGCRAPLTCADLQCDATRPCSEGPAGQDASCGCPPDQGWDYTLGAGGGCRPCGPGGIQSASLCTGEGEQLRLVNADGIDNGSCFCMTVDGYYPNASNRAEKCDLDEDGWVTSAARGVIEDDRRNVYENARCHLRTVTEISLVSEGGIEDPIAIAPLPLYESPRNDGAPSIAHPPYGYPSSTEIPTSQLNSLTKACNIMQGDYNDNAIWDVLEAHGMDPGDVVGSGLVDYYRQYAKFSYFIELHEGFFVPGADPTGPGTYVIRERPRLDASPRQIDLEHPAAPPSPDAPAYWRQCQRHDDALYGSAAVSSTVGSDFRGHGMHHHSQFKCVVGTVEINYDQANWSAETTPWRVSATIDPTVAGWREAESFRGELGRPNDCELAGPDYQAAAADPINPRFPELTCTASTLATDGNRAQWIVVDYMNAGPDEDHAANPEYLRGCINECAELKVNACPTYPVQQGEEIPGGFKCDHSAPDDFGRIECGCGLNYSGIGTGCALGCPNAGADVHHFESPGTTVFDRSGYWMCVDPSTTANASLTSGGFRLRGGTLSGGTDGAALEAQTADGQLIYRVSGRARLEVSAGN